MRMRLFELLQAALGAFRYGPTVSCQKIGIYIDESLANNRARSNIQMPQGRRTRTAMLCIAVAYRTRRSAWSAVRMT